MLIDIDLDEEYSKKLELLKLREQMTTSELLQLAIDVLYDKRQSEHHVTQTSTQSCGPNSADGE